MFRCWASFRFLEDLINYGDPYEKLPKVVPYIVLPVSMLLLVLRFAQAASADRAWRPQTVWLQAMKSKMSSTRCAPNKESMTDGSRPSFCPGHRPLADRRADCCLAGAVAPPCSC